MNNRQTKEKRKHRTDRETNYKGHSNGEQANC